MAAAPGAFAAHSVVALASVKLVVKRAHEYRLQACELAPTVACAGVYTKPRRRPLCNHSTKLLSSTTYEYSTGIDYDTGEHMRLRPLQANPAQAVWPGAVVSGSEF